jgi:hypothetical protein
MNFSVSQPACVALFRAYPLDTHTHHI